MADPGKNTAALSQLGNLYQYLVALEVCLTLPRGKVVALEKFGDITTADYQYELKHHNNTSHVLVDTHVDLWKTLKNWVDNRSSLQAFSGLVLLTSSVVRDASMVGRWHDLDVDQRYIELRKIFDMVESDLESYKTIRPFVIAVFSFNHSYTCDDLKYVLSRVHIKHSYERAVILLENLYSHSALSAVPVSHRRSILKSMLGYIAVKGIESPSAWELEVDDLQSFLIEQNRTLALSDRVYFPDLYDISPSEIEYEHRYIKAIQAIPYNEEIVDAAQDYYFCMRTVSRIADNDPYHLKKFSSNVEGLGKDLRLLKKNISLKIDDMSERSLIKNSRILYTQGLLDIKGVGESGDFRAKKFNKGMLHSYVNDSDFHWRISLDECDD